MIGARIKKALIGAACAGALALGLGAGPAQGAPSDPLFVFIPTPPPPSNPPLPVVPPPTGYLNGPCGLAVDASGRFYVADYYHHAVDLFKPTVNVAKPWEAYAGQLPNVDPLDGPCGLALNSSSQLYVNNYHRNVTKFNASPAFGTGTVLPLPAEDTSHHLPTGVAVDTVTDTVYVNHRTYISAFDSAGNPVMDGPEPLRIGLGSLGDGYGLAFSQYPGTFGRLYVPDAASDTVKVYDPAADKVNPVAEIKDPFNQPFVSLRDSAIAVDRVTGEIYFADNTQPQYTEKPQAQIYVYKADNGWKGRLKYKVIDALPPGLAVDNSAGLTQGRVYVTSGNTHQAGVYAYPPGAATTAPALPPSFGLSLSAGGSGQGTITSSLGEVECSAACEAEIRSGAEVVLTATPDPGSAFTGWSGACTGPTPTCAVAMDEAASVTAGFAELAASTPIVASSFPAAASTAPQQRTSRRKARCRRGAKRRQRSAQRKRGCRRHRSSTRR